MAEKPQRPLGPFDEKQAEWERLLKKKVREAPWPARPVAKQMLNEFQRAGPEWRGTVIKWGFRPEHPEAFDQWFQRFALGLVSAVSEKHQTERVPSDEQLLEEMLREIPGGGLILEMLRKAKTAEERRDILEMFGLAAPDEVEGGAEAKPSSPRESKEARRRRAIQRIMQSFPQILVPVKTKKRRKGGKPKKPSIIEWHMELWRRWKRREEIERILGPRILVPVEDPEERRRREIERILGPRILVPVEQPRKKRRRKKPTSLSCYHRNQVLLRQTFEALGTLVGAPVHPRLVQAAMGHQSRLVNGRGAYRSWTSRLIEVSLPREPSPRLKRLARVRALAPWLAIAALVLVGCLLLNSIVPLGPEFALSGFFGLSGGPTATTADVVTEPPSVGLGLPEAPAATPTPTSADQAAAPATATATVAVAVGGERQPPTSTPIPLATVPTEERAVLAPTATPTPVTALRAEVNVDRASCRYGDGKAHLFKYGARRGDTFEVRGRNFNGSWLWGLLAGYQGGCWISASLLMLPEGTNILALPALDAKSMVPVTSYAPKPSGLTVKRQGDNVVIQWDPSGIPGNDFMGYVAEIWFYQDGGLYRWVVGTKTNPPSFKVPADRNTQVTVTAWNLHSRGYSPYAEYQGTP